MPYPPCPYQPDELDAWLTESQIAGRVNEHFANAVYQIGHTVATCFRYEADLIGQETFVRVAETLHDLRAGPGLYDSLAAVASRAIDRDRAEYRRCGLASNLPYLEGDYETGKYVYFRPPMAVAKVQRIRETVASTAEIRASGYAGVYLHGPTWTAIFVHNRQRIRSPGHHTPESAARAYDQLAREHGYFCRLNFPTAEDPKHYRGVTATRGRYVAGVYHDGKNRHAGTHLTAEAAARAYDQKARELFGANAVLNFPDENILPPATRPDKTSQYRGVSLHGRSGLFRARVLVGRKEYSAGYFPTADAAARAYDVKAKELFGVSAKLNFP